PCYFFSCSLCSRRHPPSFPTRRSSDLPSSPRAATLSTPRSRRRLRSPSLIQPPVTSAAAASWSSGLRAVSRSRSITGSVHRSNQIGRHTSELQSLAYLVCRLLLEKKKK